MDTRSSVGSTYTTSYSLLPPPVSSSKSCLTAAAKRYKFLKRMVKVQQMDFEFAMWQTLYLFISPQKVFRDFQVRIWKDTCICHFFFPGRAADCPLCLVCDFTKRLKDPFCSSPTVPETKQGSICSRWSSVSRATSWMDSHLISGFLVIPSLQILAVLRVHPLPVHSRLHWFRNGHRHWSLGSNEQASDLLTNSQKSWTFWWALIWFFFLQVHATSWMPTPRRGVGLRVRRPPERLLPAPDHPPHIPVRLLLGFPHAPRWQLPRMVPRPPRRELLLGRCAGLLLLHHVPRLQQSTDASKHAIHAHPVLPFGGDISSQHHFPLALCRGLYSSLQIQCLKREQK